MINETASMRTYIYAFLIIILGHSVSAAPIAALTLPVIPGQAAHADPPKTDTKCYELRIYSCFPGRRDALIQRFKDDTRRVFAKHKMESIGYWLPADSSEYKLYYILAYPSRVARDSAWNAFHADPEWIEVARKSEENGKLVEKVTSVFMNLADISPAIKPSKGKPANSAATNRATGDHSASSKATNRTFELRTYYCPPGKLPNLLARFRDHTIKLFNRHGLESIAYWTTADSAGLQPHLVYMLAHPSRDAAVADWAAFRSDQAWVSAKADSEKDGPIVETTQSVFLTPLSFSAIR
ncbi:MAG TPA: NIPSNAP family protein [Puia sp.]